MPLVSLIRTQNKHPRNSILQSLLQFDVLRRQEFIEHTRCYEEMLIVRFFGLQSQKLTKRL